MSESFKQLISAPAEEDIAYIARLLVDSQRVVQDILGQVLGTSQEDIQKLQAVVDSGAIEREATWALQSLGIAFGKIFVDYNEGYDWWMVEDDYGRDVCVRYRDTTLLFFPQTMISKRVESGEDVNIADMYAWLVNELGRLRDENYS